MLTAIVFMLVIASNVLVGVIAIVTSRAAKHAAARADAALVEASHATTAALKARADLRKVTNLLLAEVERAQAARSHPPAEVSYAAPSYDFIEQRELASDNAEIFGGRVEAEFHSSCAEMLAAIEAGEPRTNFLFSAKGTPFARKSQGRLEWEAMQPHREGSPTLMRRVQLPNGIPVHDFTGDAADAMAKGVSVRAPFVSLAQLGASEPSSNEFVISPNDMNAILDRRYAA